MPSIYLDNAATTRPDPRILEAMLPYLGEEYGNPLSPHSMGRRALERLESARREVAALVGCRCEEVCFTSSATEANNLALKGVFRASGRVSSRILVSPLEHVSVLHPLRTLAAEGATIQTVRVSELGQIDFDHCSELLRERVALVSVGHGNPEIGTLQSVRAIARMARDAGAIVHTDATMTAGLFPGLWKDLEVDLMTLSPHLFHGPKGIAALVVRSGTRLRPLVEGGVQEGGLRAGTLNVGLAAGFGEASRLAREEAPRSAVRLRSLERQLRSRLEKSLLDWIPTGDPESRIPGHLSLCVRFVEGEAILDRLDDAGILAGSGSACTRGAGKPSHVLQAVGIDTVLSRGSLEFCFGRLNASTDPEAVARYLPAIVAELRRLSPLTPVGRPDL